MGSGSVSGVDLVSVTPPKLPESSRTTEQSKMKKKEPVRQKKNDDERVKREKTRRDANNARER